MFRRKLLALCLVVVLLSLGALLQQSAQSWSGWVGRISDSNCGAVHKMSDAKQCTLQCVKKGAKYVLLVGEPTDHIYKLEGNSSEFEKLAGAPAKVQGDLSGTTLKVTKAESE